MLYDISEAPIPDDVKSILYSRYVDKLAYLSLRSFSNESKNVTDFIADHIEMWMHLLPATGNVLVRTYGWMSLWDVGYSPKSPATFLALARSSLVTAIRSDPVGSTWWLEVLPECKTPDRLTMTRYFAFLDNGDEWFPSIVVNRDSVSQVVEIIAKEYGDALLIPKPDSCRW